ncbi:MAG: 50S ribosomal protein L13 [Candidatus Uhrbacteria bacterium GW2011_GWD2_41_121]|uniref:Large ribosomal subunit protein uL13 n=1 Tax=Candidatus Uhrbacteria bacterium GW2011_GWC1_41_20 TaxID=1618983 RepID=A0A0G0VF69_9BACT|nr:MAG: 50S ribosomal protein L13 [Candidatus Uhrbacteria bacterium GW2011_GWE1_39_46]KKR63551.1 MAG: 50S ribosomal protein L13 [Candidatus Uhrbacteria bacterium GW2011_GWC2_40_450]KKR89711.1 MAG: 50S ribosomal protein L13 [Candidatus Uhrbacteria bacterium GW2011_GWE2_41_1153]KKR89745.1 MAG: 50S ribosomal protein L13 [Candidatus Uhrbacteria bacterium GW2011_GWD2_41_121]KKR95586.1 MAG: 50S ribosomal protein L13 [Candidatus Uhrbacteria bacterium GW2011_GWD1_41_16]KKR98306.1 MAG: 50S ribosomal pr
MEEIKREIYKVDATDQVLGRLAGDIATHLIGKYKPSYRPNIDAGDIIEVTNVAKMKITGKKMQQKKYFSHSQYPGGLKTKTMEVMFAENPAKVLEAAVSRMLPKTKCRVERLKRLKIS